MASDIILTNPMDEEMALNMGPHHPSTHGVLRFVVYSDGEIVRRCVPDVGYQASSRTGVLVYDTDFSTGAGWFIVGGTSSGSPQWAAIVAIADQANGGPLGYINPALYKIGANPARYANDFFDVTTGNNQANPSIPGFSAVKGWDAVTGFGTPNAANLVPDLVAAVHGK